MRVEARIRHRFRGFALDVDLASSGPVLGVFGRSGSGKTTLLHALAGILRPQRAEVRVGGELLCRRPGRVWVPPERRRLAIVPQEALLFPHLSTRRNLTYAPGAAAELEGPRGRQILEVLRLRALLDRNPGTLSGGERQRVSLGRALLSRPRLLLLDEPASSLDAELAREVMALLLEAKRVLEVPMLFVTHRPTELLAIADDCVVLSEGRIVAQGPPLEVLSRPRAIGVANLLGIDNLLRLEVQRHDEEAGVTRLALGDGLELAVPLCAAGIGAQLDVGFYAQDVILCRHAPTAISARNVLPGRILRLERLDRELLVSIRIGEIELRARITPGAARELELERGQPIFALIKTAACHHLSESAPR